MYIAQSFSLLLCSFCILWCVFCGGEVQVPTTLNKTQQQNTVVAFFLFFVSLFLKKNPPVLPCFVKHSFVRRCCLQFFFSAVMSSFSFWRFFCVLVVLCHPAFPRHFVLECAPLDSDVLRLLNEIAQLFASVSLAAKMNQKISPRQRVL